MPLVINTDLTIGESTLQKLKTAETTTPTAPTTQQSDAKLSAQIGSTGTAAQVDVADPYYTQVVGDTGLTQAQLDARDNAIAVAKLIGGTTKPNPAGGLTVVKPVNTFIPENPPASGFGGADNGATTNLQILKASLRGLGFSAAIIDSSTVFLDSLLKEGLDYDNATEIFLNNKEYTLKDGKKITSPFYTEYGYLNEGLVVPKSANELFNTVEGFKGVVDKYKLSSKYLTQDSLKSYVKNDVTVKDLSERAATAQLRAVEAGQFQVNALIKLGYISSATDLTDFYMDAKIGKEQLELNRQSGVFTAEALRRAKSGVSTSAEQLAGFKQLTATLAAKGYNEAQISQLAAQGFENIAGEINPMTKFGQIYDKAGGTVESNTTLTEGLQKELLAEEFQGTASERRKRYTELEQRAFQGESGRLGGRQSTAGIF